MRNNQVVSPRLTYEIQRPVRWNTFVAGLAINLILIALVAEVAPRLAREVTVRSTDATHYVTLVAPRIYAPAPRKVDVPPQVARLEPPELSPVVAPKPVASPKPFKTEAVKVQLPKPAPQQPESRHIETNVFEATTATNKPAPQPEIKTNVFGSAPSQTATLQKPARQPQTGGFGDPNGVAGQGDPRRDTVAMVHVGSFGAPAGPGNGNGTSGATGASGTLRSAGFRTEVASAAPARSGTVTASGFGTPVTPSSDFTPAHIEKKPELRPVEIVYKPRPAYTAEARRMRVEGEVLLDVIFTASGSLRVNRVVKGLGYGLDDKALEAAGRIQFRPARRDGQPYDCAALVHMVFELAK
jgi:TonB family protein